MKHSYTFYDREKNPPEDTYKFCPLCGSNLAIRKINPNPRLACTACKFVHFRNPAPSVSVMVVDGDQVQVGNPTVEGAAVKATVMDQVKGKKVRTFKYTGKKYRRRLGHRQRYTRLRVDEIVL